MIRLAQIEELVIEWCAKNEWMNDRPKEHDMAFIYFYNFFSKKLKGLTKEMLDDALWRLYMEDLLEVETNDETCKIEIIRGLTPKGLEYYKYFLE